MQDEQLLRAAVDRATRNYNVYPSSFREIREDYRARYGERAWIGKLTADLYGIKTPGQSGFAKGSPEYRQASREYYSARRNIERWEQGTRSPGVDARERLKAIGRELPPLRRDVPPDGLTIVVNFRAPADGSHGSSRTRQATMTLDYAFAVQFVQNPNWTDLWNLWFDGGADIYGEDGDYPADVYEISVA